METAETTIATNQNKGGEKADTTQTQPVQEDSLDSLLTLEPDLPSIYTHRIQDIWKYFKYQEAKNKRVLVFERGPVSKRSHFYRQWIAQKAPQYHAIPVKNRKLKTNYTKGMVEELIREDITIIQFDTVRNQYFLYDLKNNDACNIIRKKFRQGIMDLTKESAENSVKESAEKTAEKSVKKTAEMPAEESVEKVVEKPAHFDRMEVLYEQVKLLVEKKHENEKDVAPNGGTSSSKKRTFRNVYKVPTENVSKIPDEK